MNSDTIYFHKSLKIKNLDGYCEKIGINEVDGLKVAMARALQPIRKAIADKAYWLEFEHVTLHESEYKHRDGFIPYAHNCGGLEIIEILPKIEIDNFGIIPHYECFLMDGENFENHECDEHCAAKLRVWLKFEGFENGEMKFYLYCGGGDSDAPHFRVKYEDTFFEHSFTAKTLKQFETRAKKAVQKLLKELE